jgi:DNA-binding winged helix-turn-helix (wHTH) protein/tetratricopeptide (TPR) repeat protein
LNTQSQSDARLAVTYRFGSFEVRVTSGILLRRGERIKIQELPFRMLLMLLEHAGEVVPREALRSRLWGDRTFVEFDSNLRVAAAKLREALGDNVTDARYFETVSGRGYRFIAEVVTVEEVQPIVMQEALLAEFAPASPPNLAVPVIPDSPQISRNFATRWRRWSPAYSAVVCLVPAVALFIYWYTHQALIHSQDKVVVGSFINSTDDASFSGALALPFHLKLEESPYLSLVSNQRFQHLIHDSAPSFENELHACGSLDGKVLLRGELVVSGKGFQSIVRAFRCEDGKLLAAEKAYASSTATVLLSVDQAVEAMRGRLGESRNSLQRFNVPLMQATTGSLAALRAFNQGEEKHLNGRDTEAIVDYKLAIDLDPQFALAYARLGTVYSNAGEDGLRRKYFQGAFDLRERTTDREKLYIAASYYSFATGENWRAVHAYELWSQVYPRDVTPANNLATQYLQIGQPEKAVAAALRATQLDPQLNVPYAVLAQAYMRAGHYPELKQLCDDPEHGKIAAVSLHFSCYEGAFAEQDATAMDRQQRWAEGNPQQSALIGASAAGELSYGHMHEARRLFALARQSAIGNNLPEFAAATWLDLASLDADMGLQHEAGREAAEGIALAPDSADAGASAALVYARAGDISEAEIQAQKAHAKAPLDTILNFAELATVRASIQMLQHDTNGAIRTFEETSPYDLCAVMGLSSIYYRGLAYLEAKQRDRAIRAFQSVIDHRATTPTSPYIVLSQLELGRAYQLAGDTANARRMYRVLDERWKTADPDFPPLQELRRSERLLKNDMTQGTPHSL